MIPKVSPSSNDLGYYFKPITDGSENPSNSQQATSPAPPAHTFPSSILLGLWEHSSSSVGNRGAKAQELSKSSAFTLNGSHSQGACYC